MSRFSHSSGVIGALGPLRVLLIVSPPKKPNQARIPWLIFIPDDSKIAEKARGWQGERSGPGSAASCQFSVFCFLFSVFCFRFSVYWSSSESSTHSQMQLGSSAKILSTVILRERSDRRISKLRVNTRSFASLRMTNRLFAEVSIWEREAQGLAGEIRAVSEQESAAGWQFLVFFISFAGYLLTAGNSLLTAEASLAGFAAGCRHSLPSPRTVAVRKDSLRKFDGRLLAIYRRLERISPHKGLTDT